MKKPWESSLSLLASLHVTPARAPPCSPQARPGLGWCRSPTLGPVFSFGPDGKGEKGPPWLLRVPPLAQPGTLCSAEHVASIKTLPCCWPVGSPPLEEQLQVAELSLLRCPGAPGNGEGRRAAGALQSSLVSGKRPQALGLEGAGVFSWASVGGTAATARGHKCHFCRQGWSQSPTAFGHPHCSSPTLAWACAGSLADFTQCPISSAPSDPGSSQRFTDVPLASLSIPSNLHPCSQALPLQRWRTAQKAS